MAGGPGRRGPRRAWPGHEGLRLGAGSTQRRARPSWPSPARARARDPRVRAQAAAAGAAALRADGRPDVGMRAEAGAGRAVELGRVSPALGRPSRRGGRRCSPTGAALGRGHAAAPHCPSRSRSARRRPPPRSGGGRPGRPGRPARGTAAGARRPGRGRDTAAAHALNHIRAGLDDLHAWQSSFGSLDLQTNVVGHGVRLAVRGLALAVESRSDAVLFEWSERARMLASRIQPVRAPQDPQTAADLAELRAEPAPEREAELRRRIREQAWQRKGSGEVADPVRWPSSRPGWARTRLWWPTSSPRSAWSRWWSRRPARPATTSEHAHGSTTRWVGCCRTSTWLRRSCPTRWPGRCAARWRDVSTPWPRCSSIHSSPTSVNAGWC